MNPEPYAFVPSTPTTGGALSQIDNINDLVGRIASIGDVILYILMALAVVYIVYYIVLYFIKGSSGDESRKVAGMNILWGIVGLAIIVSIWGLVSILINTFYTDPTAPIDRFPSANFVNPSPQ